MRRPSPVENTVTIFLSLIAFGYLFYRVIKDESAWGFTLVGALFIVFCFYTALNTRPRARTVTQRSSERSMTPLVDQLFNGQSYIISADGRAITCATCLSTSHHPDDIRHRYCGDCHVFHAEPGSAPGFGPGYGGSPFDRSV